MNLIFRYLIGWREFIHTTSCFAGFILYCRAERDEWTQAAASRIKPAGEVGRASAIRRSTFPIRISQSSHLFICGLLRNHQRILIHPSLPHPQTIHQPHFPPLQSIHPPIFTSLHLSLRVYLHRLKREVLSAWGHWILIGLTMHRGVAAISFVFVYLRAWI